MTILIKRCKSYLYLYFTYSWYHIVQTTETFQKDLLSNIRDWSIDFDTPQPPSRPRLVPSSPLANGLFIEIEKPQYVLMNQSIRLMSKSK